MQLILDILASIGTAAVDVVSAITPFLGLTGVIVGAGVTGIVARNNDRRLVVIDIRREVYFETMDIAVRMYEQLRQLGTHGPQGGSDPVADKKAAKAIDRMIRLSAELIRTEARVATVGSPGAVEATYAFRVATNDYMAAVFSGEVFRVGVAARQLGRYAKTLDDLAAAIRADLGLSSLSSMLPVTRDAIDHVARLPEPAWHPDPMGRYDLRWWNGSYWSDDVTRDGERLQDPTPVFTAF